MSWRRARDEARGEGTGRRAVLLATVLGVALVVSACSGGLRPLYGPTASGGDLRSELASVEIAPIPGRVGQRIRNEMLFKTGTDGAGSKYRLDVAIRESVSSVLVEIDGNANGRVYNIDATFKLVRVKDGKVVLEGNSHSRAAYQTYPDIFSNVRARRDAENRAARTIADGIKTRLAAFLSSTA